MSNQEDEKLVSFMMRFQQWQAYQNKIWKIKIGLKQADMLKECKHEQSHFSKFFEISLLGGMFISYYKLKTISQKFASFIGLFAIKMFWMDSFIFHNYLKNLAMEEDTVIAQEVRNLYTFYFPEQAITPKLIQKIEEYNHLNRQRALKNKQ